MRTFQTDNFILSKYIHSSRGLIFSCIDKVQHTSLCNSGLVRINEKLLPIPFSYNEGQFATLISPYQYDLLQKIATYEEYPNYEEINSIIEAMGEETDEENPILILYTIKE